MKAELSTGAGLAPAGPHSTALVEVPAGSCWQEKRESRRCDAPGGKRSCATGSIDVSMLPLYSRAALWSSTEGMRLAHIRVARPAVALIPNGADGLSQRDRLPEMKVGAAAFFSRCCSG